jgi:putative copper resistance protein D
MEGIADFLDSVLSGIDLCCYSLLIGSLLWGWVVLRPWQKTPECPVILLRSSSRLFYYGALGLLVCQTAALVLKAWLIHATLGISPFPAFTQTVTFQAGLWRALFAGLLSFYLYYVLSKQPTEKSAWIISTALTVPLILAGAWLVHAVGSFEYRGMLMGLTVVHQFAAATWVGGVLQILNLWRLYKKQSIDKQFWGLFLHRFSKLGIGAVGLLVLSGAPIALHYIDTFNGLVGTGYGSLLLVKIMLLAIALGFAFLNRQAVLEALSSGRDYALLQRVPFYIEAETFVLITLLFVAASLASQPPTIDIAHLTATWQEVLDMFLPKMPRLISPSEQALLAGEAGRLAILAQTPSQAATAWSDYNHNIAGVFLTIMTFCAMLSYSKLFRWLRFWPTGFIALGIFILLRSDAESWPAGPLGFWESTFKNGEILQHRLATLLVLCLGSIELRARLAGNPNNRWAYVFPILSGVGGLILLTHSHVGFQAKSAFLIQIGHILMGFFALVLACGRWLELRLDNPGKQIAGFVSVFALFQIGLILLFYREPLY